jgi:hypothetical protein
VPVAKRAKKSATVLNLASNAVAASGKVELQPAVSSEVDTIPLKSAFAIGGVRARPQSANQEAETQGPTVRSQHIYEHHEQSPRAQQRFARDLFGPQRGVAPLKPTQLPLSPAPAPAPSSIEVRAVRSTELFASPRASSRVFVPDTPNVGPGQGHARRTSKGEHGATERQHVLVAESPMK